MPRLKLPEKQGGNYPRRRGGRAAFPEQFLDQVWHRRKSFALPGLEAIPNLPFAGSRPGDSLLWGSRPGLLSTLELVRGGWLGQKDYVKRHASCALRSISKPTRFRRCGGANRASIMTGHLEVQCYSGHGNAADCRAPGEGRRFPEVGGAMRSESPRRASPDFCSPVPTSAEVTLNTIVGFPTFPDGGLGLG